MAGLVPPVPIVGSAAVSRIEITGTRPVVTGDLAKRDRTAQKLCLGLQAGRPA
jgi:hypothetical protein